MSRYTCYKGWKDVVDEAAAVLRVDDVTVTMVVALVVMSCDRVELREVGGRGREEGWDVSRSGAMEKNRTGIRAKTIPLSRVT